MQPLESYQIQDHNFTLKPDESLLILGKRCHKKYTPSRKRFQMAQTNRQHKGEKGNEPLPGPIDFHRHTYRFHHSVIENKHIIPDTPMNEKSIKYKR